jgi:Tfp pilus assembly ATPase PilU
MHSILIDKLLQAAVFRKATELYITGGEPPALRIAGRLKRLETKPLNSEDVAAIVADILPGQSREEFEHELEETGRTEFVYAFGKQTWSHVLVAKESGIVAIAFSLR